MMSDTECECCGCRCGKCECCGCEDCKNIDGTVDE